MSNKNQVCAQQLIVSIDHSNIGKLCLQGRRLAAVERRHGKNSGGYLCQCIELCVESMVFGYNQCLCR